MLAAMNTTRTHLITSSNSSDIPRLRPRLTPTKSTVMTRTSNQPHCKFSRFIPIWHLRPDLQAWGILHTCRDASPVPNCPNTFLLAAGNLRLYDWQELPTQKLMDIDFKCPHCEQDLSADANDAGTEIE